MGGKIFRRGVLFSRKSSPRGGIFYGGEIYHYTGSQIFFANFVIFARNKKPVTGLLFPPLLFRQDCTLSNGHHNCLHKQGRRRCRAHCSLLWRILTWCSRKQLTLKARHISGRLNVVADKLSKLGQIIQTEWSLLPEVFQLICIRWHQPKIDHFATRFNKLPCVTSFRCPSFHSRCTQYTFGRSGPICLLTSSHSGQGCGETKGLPVQENHPDRVAQHELVLGSGSHVKPDPSVPAQPAQTADSTIQSNSTQESAEPKSLCLAHRTSVIKEQGFSQALASQIETPQRLNWIRL